MMLAHTLVEGMHGTLQWPKTLEQAGDGIVLQAFAAHHLRLCGPLSLGQTPTFEQGMDIQNLHDITVSLHVECVSCAQS